MFVFGTFVFFLIFFHLTFTLFFSYALLEDQRMMRLLRIAPHQSSLEKALRKILRHRKKFLLGKKWTDSEVMMIDNSISDPNNSRWSQKSDLKSLLGR